LTNDQNPKFGQIGLVIGFLFYSSLNNHLLSSPNDIFTIGLSLVFLALVIIISLKSSIIIAPSRPASFLFPNICTTPHYRFIFHNLLIIIIILAIRGPSSIRPQLSLIL
jgi:hypothetical protein